MWCNTFGLKQGCGAILLGINNGVEQYFGLNKGVVQYFGLKQECGAILVA